MRVTEGRSSHRLLFWASTARSVRSRVPGRAGHLRRSSLLFGHGAAVACDPEGAVGICIDPLQLGVSVHDVKIAVLDAAADQPCHCPVTVRIHGIGAICNDVYVISGLRSNNPVVLKGAGRGRERDETDGTARDELT